MTGKTISAYTDEETARRVVGIAKTERRSRAQIAGMALKLLVGLPKEARAALWEIEALGNDEDLKDVTEAITRTLLNVRYKIAHRQILQEMSVEDLGQLETEDDILAVAVTITDNG